MQLGLLIFCPLMLRMADRWRDAAPVDLHLLPEAPHGFIHSRTRMAAKVLAASYDWLNASISGGRRIGDLIPRAAGAMKPCSLSGLINHRGTT